MHNIKLTVAYDGSDFHGWQIQPGHPTIQGVLSEVLGRITQEPVTLYGAGRTDAGVHAWGQVANFQTESAIKPPELARAVNALLPASIRVREAEEVCGDFHARWLACAKTYRYRICREKLATPFQWRYVLHYPYALDFVAMADAARLLEGEHDFTSFSASSGSEEQDRQRSMQRHIYSSDMRQTPWAIDGEMLPDREGTSPNGEWTYGVRGRSFLRHMVRKIMGTLLEVGRGRMAPEDIPALLQLRDRARSGPTVAPQGLCLVSVEYPEPSIGGGGAPLE